MKKKVVPKLRQDVKVKVDIITSDDIKIYFTGKFQDFTARYIIKSTTGDPKKMRPMNISIYSLLFKLIVCIFSCVEKSLCMNI